MTKNRAIEIHDSILAALSLHDGCAVLRFSSVYIHESKGTPGVDAGSGWRQEAELRVSNAAIDGSFSELPRDLNDGYVSMDGTISDNTIPIPLDYKGKVELQLEGMGEVISVSGTGAKLKLIGEAEYVEKFNP
jgi:hypothetical protein